MRIGDFTDVVGDLNAPKPTPSPLGRVPHHNLGGHGVGQVLTTGLGSTVSPKPFKRTTVTRFGRRLDFWGWEIHAAAVRERLGYKGRHKQ